MLKIKSSTHVEVSLKCDANSLAKYAAIEDSAESNCDNGNHGNRVLIGDKYNIPFHVFYFSLSGDVGTDPRKQNPQ